ncbi:MAG: D-alanyl-D-alanine carboxypeptidase family protein [Paracoccaceae bacterium]
MKKPALAALLLAFLAALWSLPAAAAFETRARAAWVFDQTTGTVLLEKNANEALPPASMSKLMTLNMLFEALADGRVTMDTTFAVSSKARAMGGSTMFLNERDRPTVRELIQGIIVLSGNDACVVVAEGLAGTEEAFARLMTERAKAIGLTQSTFANASGWPDPNQRMSVHDLGRLAKRLIEEFPEYYGYFGETEFPYDNRAPQNRFNRNPLLKLDIGADGLKTGHTTEAGYGLVGSAKQGDRRVIFVISGLASEAERAEESERIVNWAFRQFVQKTVVKSGTRLAEAEVWMGAERRVGLVARSDVSLLVPALVQEGLKATVAYTGPVKAPVAEGQELGELIIDVPSMAEVRVPLVAEAPVPAGGILRRFQTAAADIAARLSGYVPSF